MASIPTFPSLSANATMDQVIEHVAILQKTISFMMSSINSTNITEVGGYVASDTDLMASNGAVGFSSADTAGNDLRIWAGNATTSVAPFRVYEDGSFIATKATITGDINMTGGTISWSAITPPSYGQITGVKPPTDADHTVAVLNLRKGDGSSKGIFYNFTTDQYELDIDKVTAGSLSATRISGNQLTLGDTLQFNFGNTAGGIRWGSGVSAPGLNYDATFNQLSLGHSTAVSSVVLYAASLIDLRAPAVWANGRRIDIAQVAKYG